MRYVDRAGEQGSAVADDELTAQLPGLLPPIHRFALRLTRDRHDADDLLQRACVRGLERRHQLRPGTSTLSWMFSIVRSVWLNEVRARQLRNHIRLQWSETLANIFSSSAAIDPEADTLYRQVLAAVECLPNAQRDVMVLVAAEGISYLEAAETLGVPIGTIMSRLARARVTIGQAFR